MPSSLYVGKVMSVHLSLESKAMIPFITILQNVLKTKEIALLLVPDALRLSLGKMCNAHLLPALLSALAPQMKC